MGGSEDRFTELYERHHGDVWRYVTRRIVGAEVGDVVAEVFLVAWRRLNEVPTEPALPWLYGVARLVLANEARGRRRWRELTLRVAAERDQAVVADHADEVTSKRDVAVAFDQVPATDREVLRLVAWERLTAAEAAVVLGCSRATFTSPPTAPLPRPAGRCYDAVSYWRPAGWYWRWLPVRWRWRQFGSRSRRTRPLRRCSPTARRRARNRPVPGCGAWRRWRRGSQHRHGRPARWSTWSRRTGS